jgi:hypothetical protein
MRLSPHHETLNELGEGKCSAPMWMGGTPCGFCDATAYGVRPPCKTRFNHAAREEMREDGRYNGYVPALACPAHGGPPKPPATHATLVGRAVDVLQRHAPPDGLSDHDALSELYGIFDGPEYREVQANNVLR